MKISCSSYIRIIIAMSAQTMDATESEKLLITATMDSWNTSPRRAFSDWQRARLLGSRGRGSFVARSNRQYESMFGRVCAWLESEGLSLKDMRPEDIAQFLGTIEGRGGSAADSTVRRYLTLLEKVFDYLNSIASPAALGNPARDLLVTPDYRYREPPSPVFLDQDASRRYIDWVNLQVCSSWVGVRDKALRTVFIASGLMVDEVRRLRVSDAVMLDAKVTQLHICSHLSGSLARVVPVASWAWPALTEWYRLRKAIVAPTDALFLTRSADFKIDDPGESAVSPTEIYTIIQEAMVAIGHTGRRQGPQSLRHTFTARQLLAGVPKDRIAEWLGLRTTESISCVERQLPFRGDIHPA